jgi:glycosyltransferase involved in cell wall biosynthesis
MRLAIVTSHPIQYNAPWFRFLTEHGLPDLRVFYLWTSGVIAQRDPGFGVHVTWDIPLLEGYDHEFVPNRSRHPGTSSISGLNNPQLSERLDAYRPDCVLVFGYNNLSCYRLLASRTGRRTPLLFRGDSHRLIARSGAGARLRNFWTRSVFSRFSGFLFVGQANRDYFKSFGVPDDRLFFSPHAVDNVRFFSDAAAAARDAAEWRRELGIAPSSRVVLFAGKFEEKKRPRDLIAAFRKVALRDATLVMVGNGPQEADLRRDAEGSPNIVFAPFQNQTRMPRTYLLGDLFVLPSYGAEESWGLAVNEAMCMGRPVVASNHVGCAQDLVQSGVNGLTFPAGDVEALARVLGDALSNGERLTNWGLQSRRIVGAFSYENATRGLFAALESVRGHVTVS